SGLHSAEVSTLATCCVLRVALFAASGAHFRHGPGGRQPLKPIFFQVFFIFISTPAKSAACSADESLVTVSKDRQVNGRSSGLYWRKGYGITICLCPWSPPRVPHAYSCTCNRRPDNTCRHRPA